MQDVCIFRRIEKKYLITEAQSRALLERIGPDLKADAHGESTVCSLYLDTPDWLLIRNCIFLLKLRHPRSGQPRISGTEKEVPRRGV